MATRERKDVYKLPAGDRTLYWYGRAITALRARATTEPTSWRYQAAIHGFDAASPFWAGAGTLPPSTERSRFWDQCQHGTWYFLPWHRMYLAYFEQIVLQTIVSLGGPSTWALPFWNYSDTTNPAALTMPPAFTSGTPASNPLQMPAAGGLPGRVNTVLQARDVSLTNALASRVFVGMYTGGSTGFGGVITGFNHLGNGHGLVEYTPHDFVHADIGGAMNDVATAALDPIFWLHHANIDRLWQVWLNQGGRSNPTDSRWLTQPFSFHDSRRNVVTLTPAQVMNTTLILGGYTYQGVHPVAGEGVEEGLAREEREPVHCGSTTGPIHLEGQAEELTFHFNPGMDAPYRDDADAWLNFEAIIGKGIAPIHDVYVNMPERCADPERYLLCSLPLFGSDMPPGHGRHGMGITYAVNVTAMVEELRERGEWRPGTMRLHIQPRAQHDGGHGYGHRHGHGHPRRGHWHVTIGRLTFYGQ
ncbi:hypothetical protein E4L96_11740 [Massilia arenosa]|uniref:Tyrosinase copper-binding domain-containing protein n=1 Tax=Zemynaea arenosa TaxID=2561931 RepID=A0A4Y9SBZ4_9BURK|nr:tyrosinase family protein [Massilia arenosa]TFW19502.1 hypothetical protein E4L96_11740 [Massilia arenosa]